MPKKRLDTLIQERFPEYSRRQIQSWIMQGYVRIKGVPVTKAGTMVDELADIECKFVEPKYVSRGGYKLEAALEQFNIPVKGLIALDAGISTGGFTDCLLQHGVSKVYGIDVGYGQIADKIRHDSRVIIKERTNLRGLTYTDIGEHVDLITLDLSFISVLKVLDAILSVLKSQGMLIVLIKPQFEAEKHEVGRGGIIRDDALRQTIVEKVTHGVEKHGFRLIGLIDSPIEGATGNKEFLAYFVRTS